jgi:hypothetical protein
MDVGPATVINKQDSMGNSTTSIHDCNTMVAGAYMYTADPEVTPNWWS